MTCHLESIIPLLPVDSQDANSKRRRNKEKDWQAVKQSALSISYLPVVICQTKSFALLIMTRLRFLVPLVALLLLPCVCFGFSTHSSFLARPTTSSRLGVAAATSRQQQQQHDGSSPLWSMHMGHSHSHHHHHHHHHNHGNNNNNNSAAALMRPTSVRRKISLVVFAACVVLAPRLVMKKAITRAHSATFVLTCIALSMMDQIRGGFATIIDKLRVSQTVPPFTQLA